MKKTYKSLFRRLILLVIIFTGVLFLTSFTTAPKSEDQTAAPEVPAEVPPKEGPEIEHPLPKEPVAVVTPMASAHFTMAEYACDCEGYCDGFPADMDPMLLEKIEVLRCVFDRPIIITSGVRCVKRNDEVFGIPNSRHLSGHAADLYCPEIPYTEVAQVARDLGLGVIEYPDGQFDHVEIWQ